MQYGQNSFTPKKNNRLDANSRAGSPAKLRNFKIEYHHGSKTVVLDYLKFLILQNQQQCPTISSTPWKGKFSHLSGTKKVNTANRTIEKADYYIGDSTRTIKVTLWENFSISGQDGKKFTSPNAGFEPGHTIGPILHCNWNCPFKKTGQGDNLSFKNLGKKTRKEAHI